MRFSLIGSVAIALTLIGLPLYLRGSTERECARTGVLPLLQLEFGYPVALAFLRSPAIPRGAGVVDPANHENNRSKHGIRGVHPADKFRGGYSATPARNEAVYDACDRVRAKAAGQYQLAPCRRAADAAQVRPPAAAANRRHGHIRLGPKLAVGNERAVVGSCTGTRSKDTGAELCAFMKSMLPDQPVATTGLPSCIASAGTRPKPSERWSDSTISTAAMRPDMSAGGSMTLMRRMFGAPAMRAPAHPARSARRRVDQFDRQQPVGRVAEGAAKRGDGGQRIFAREAEPMWKAVSTISALSGRPRRARISGVGVTGGNGCGTTRTGGPWTRRPQRAAVARHPDFVQERRLGSQESGTRGNSHAQ